MEFQTLKCQAATQQPSMNCRTLRDVITYDKKYLALIVTSSDVQKPWTAIHDRFPHNLTSFSKSFGEVPGVSKCESLISGSISISDSAYVCISRPYRAVVSLF